MIVILITFYVILILTLLFASIVLIMQFVYKYSDKRIENTRKMYKNLLISYAMSDEANVRMRKQFLNNAVKEINDDFVYVAISLLNEFEGEFRRKIIAYLDSRKVYEYLYKNLMRTKSQTYKRLYTFEIGEIRSKIHLANLLGWSNEYIEKNNLYSPYFFALQTILSEWINEESETNIRKFINKIFEIIVILEKKESWNVKRVIEFFMNDSSNLFNYFLRNDGMRLYFYSKMAEDRTTMKTKGEIIYVLAYNQEYDILPTVISEFAKYIDKEEKSNDEFEYLIDLIKAAGLIDSKESLKVLYRAAKDENWVMRAQSARFLPKHNIKRVKDILYKFLFDSNWWVRMNAAIGMQSFGEEGYEYLFKALGSDDKYAREVAAYGLTNSEYPSRCIEIIKKEGIDYIIKEIFIVINNANNINLLDELIVEKSIDDMNKIMVIEGIRTKNFVEYFQNTLKYRKISQEVFNAAEKQAAKLLSEGEVNKI